MATLKKVKTDMTITRMLDVPAETVFKAWTDCEHLSKWWGPKMFTNPVCEIDVRPGGAIRIHMKAPDGTVYPMAGTYQEIIDNERLVFKSAALDNDGKPIFEIINTIVFEEQGGKTKLITEASVISKTPNADQYLKGMNEGWNMSLDRLEEYLAKA